MAKGAKQHQAAKPAEHKQPDAAALQAELKSFASGLGFASGGSGSGFDDSDFRPPAAGQRSKPRPPTQIKPNKATPAPGPSKQVRPNGDVLQQSAQGQQQTDTPDIVRERNWNSGVGARPGDG